VIREDSRTVPMYSGARTHGGADGFRAAMASPDATKRAATLPPVGGVDDYGTRRLRTMLALRCLRGQRREALALIVEYARPGTHLRVLDSYVEPFLRGTADWGLAVDASTGVVYTSTCLESEVRRESTPLSGGHWEIPYCLALSPSGSHLFVGELFAGLVHVVGLRTPCGVAELGRGHLTSCSGIAATATHVWVPDGGAARLLVFDYEARLQGAWSYAQHVRTEGGGTAAEVLGILAIGAELLLVTRRRDLLSCRSLPSPGFDGDPHVSVFSPAMTCEPSLGQVYVTDAHRDRVLVYHLTAEHQLTQEMRFSIASPRAIVLDVARGRLYVTSQYLGRVAIVTA